MFALYEGAQEKRCPCCRKRTSVIVGRMFNEHPPGWDNFFGVARATKLAADGTCPWCGRTTTIVSRILLSRFREMSDMVERFSW